MDIEITEAKLKAKELSYKAFLQFKRLDTHTPKTFYKSSLLHTSFMQLSIYTTINDKPGHLLAQVELTLPQFVELITTMSYSETPGTLKFFANTPVSPVETADPWEILTKDVQLGIMRLMDDVDELKRELTDDSYALSKGSIVERLTNIQSLLQLTEDKTLDTLKNLTAGLTKQIQQELETRVELKQTRSPGMPDV